MTEGCRSATMLCDAYMKFSGLRNLFQDSKRGQRGRQLLYPLPLERHVYHRAAVSYRNDGAVAEFGVAHLGAHLIFAAALLLRRGRRTEPVIARKGLCGTGKGGGALGKVLVGGVERTRIAALLSLAAFAASAAAIAAAARIAVAASGASVLVARISAAVFAPAVARIAVSRIHGSVLYAELGRELL